MIRQRQPATASPPAGAASRHARTATLVLAAGAILAATAGCDTSPAPAPPPPTVIVNTPPAGDSGLAVLLAVAGIAATLFAIGAVVLFFLWCNERRNLVEERGHRASIEDEFIRLAGHSPAWNSHDTTYRYARALLSAPPVTTTPIIARPHREATP